MKLQELEGRQAEELAEFKTTKAAEKAAMLEGFAVQLQTLRTHYAQVGR